MSENNRELSRDGESIFEEDAESSDEERDIEDDEDYSCDESESPEEEEALSKEDSCLFAAVKRSDADAAAAAVQQAIRDGANVNAVRIDCSGGLRTDWTPLFDACDNVNDQIIRILLDAGADARWRTCYGSSAIMVACEKGHLSNVQLLINHDDSLLEIEDYFRRTPLIVAISRHNSDIIRFLLDSGADPHHVSNFSVTALMTACKESSLEVVRLLLAAGADVEARDTWQRTALHHAARSGSNGVVCELIFQHNANMFAVDEYGLTPFDEACRSWSRDAAVCNLLEVYGNKLTQDHGRFALHELLQVAEYSFAEDERFHPPLDPFKIILPLGKLALMHLCTLLLFLDPELIRSLDDTGKLPIHIACQTNAPVEVLALMVELDPTALRIADSTGALPIHLFCDTTAATEHAGVRYLVEQGGVGTLAARNRQGLLPLHVVCGSTNPPLQVVQYLIQSFPGSVAMPSNAGLYPFMMASAAESSTASLSVIYELVRANPGLVVPR